MFIIKFENMKKMKKNQEFEFLVSAPSVEKKEYVSSFGVCAPNQKDLFVEHREVFDELVDECKHLSNEVVSLMIEEEKYLPNVMRICLSRENQIKFVEYWPEKVNEYLQTLEETLPSDRGAYLCLEAEEIYNEFREDDPSLPELKVSLSRMNSARSGNMPFAGLAAMF